MTKREEWKEMWKNQYYRNKKTREFRDQFSAKMKTIVSDRDWIEFFEYTSFERLIENKNPQGEERKYMLYISMPVKEARARDEKTWNAHVELYIEKFKTFWWFFRKSRDAYSEIDVNEIDVIWEPKFNDGLFEERLRGLKRLEYMRAREDPLIWRDWQAILFDSLSFDKLRSDSVVKENVIDHSWNSQAIHWLNYRLSSQEINIDTPTVPSTLIYSKWSWMWKQCLVNRAKNWFREMFPNANVREMTGRKLYKIYSAVQTTKPEEARKIAFASLDRSFQNINLLIITNLEELENKIKTQQWLLELMERKNLKVIFSSNRDILDFQEVDESKTEQKWFLRGFLVKLREIPSAETTKPKNDECWPILEEILRRHKIFNIPEPLIDGIAKTLPYPNIYDALAIEIGNKCRNGACEFTIEMAHELVNKRRGNIYACSIHEVRKIVEDYFFDENATKQDIEKIDMYAAYICKKYNGLWDYEKTNDEIAKGLRIKASKVGTYVASIIKDGWEREWVEIKLKEYIKNKEEEILKKENMFK